jgi:hypothetical protein
MMFVTIRSTTHSHILTTRDSGMFSAAKRQRLSRALGRYLLAVPMRQVTEGQGEGLARPGR